MQKQPHLLLAVIATGILSFSGVLIETAMNVTFPQLINQFNISTSTVQWVTTAYLLVISIMVPFSNYLLKNYSIKSLFIVSNLVFMLGLLIDFMAPSFSVLLLGRALQGMSTGVGLPLMFHIILNFSPMEKIGVMMGIGTLTTSIAPAIGPTYGGILTSSLSWHYIFMFLIPLLLISLVLGIYAIPNIKVKKTTSLDVIHLFSVILLFSGFLLFFNNLTSVWSLIPLAVGFIGLALFIFQTKHSKNPLVNIDVLKNKTYLIYLFSFIGCHFLILGFSFVLPNFVQIVLNQSPLVAGLTIFPGAAISAFLAPVAGRFLDKFGPKKPILFGLSTIFIGLCLIIALTFKPVLWLIIVSYAIMLVGSGFAYSNLMTTGMNSVDKSQSGDANTIYNTLQQFAGAFVTTLVATIIGIAQANNSSHINGTIIGSQISFGILLIYTTASLILMLRYFKKRL